MPIAEEVLLRISQQTISTYAMYYSKFYQEVSVFRKVLTKRSLTRT